MSREQELHFTLQKQLSAEQMMMVSELLSIATNVPIEERMEAEGWGCPACDWPWSEDEA